MPYALKLIKINNLALYLTRIQVYTSNSLINEQIMNNDSVLVIKDLHYWYTHDWTGKKTHVLKGISVTVGKGEAFGFLGHNGSGKTTTIKNIMGLVKLSKGSIEICGKSSNDPMSRSKVGFVPEYPYFYDYLTVYETMYLMGRLYGLDKVELNQNIKHALGLVKFPRPASLRLRSLSKGLLQRVAIAQAIIHNPKLLILDEPFSGLDPVGRREIRDLFEDLKKQGVSLFISSHILSDVEHLCDRVSIMSAGEIKAIINVRELLSETKNHSYEVVIRSSFEIDEAMSQMGGKISSSGQIKRISFASESSAREALKLMLNDNISIEGYAKIGSTLEDVFINIVTK
jgi:ABC-2 type transport system ATP-binding protein